jgi:hypothetical protein
VSGLYGSGRVVNGTIDTNSLNLTQANDGYSLNFGYSSYDTGDYTLSGFALPDFSPMSSLDNGFGFGSPQYAAAALSLVGRQAQAGLNVSMAVTAPNYGAMAVTGGAGELASAASSNPALRALASKLALLGTSAAATERALYQAEQYLATNPDTPGNLTDFLVTAFGRDFGPIPATWGGKWGSAVGFVKEFGSEMYDRVKENIPH